MNNVNSETFPLPPLARSPPAMPLRGSSLSQMLKNPRPRRVPTVFRIQQRLRKQHRRWGWPSRRRQRGSEFTYTQHPGLLNIGLTHLEAVAATVHVVPQKQVVQQAQVSARCGVARGPSGKVERMADSKNIGAGSYTNRSVHFRYHTRTHRLQTASTGPNTARVYRQRFSVAPAAASRWAPPAAPPLPHPPMPGWPRPLEATGAQALDPSWAAGRPASAAAAAAAAGRSESQPWAAAVAAAAKRG